MEPLEQRLRYWNAPEGPWNSALRYWNAPEGLTLCATGTPQRGHGTALALLELLLSGAMERPEGAYALR